MIAKPVVVELVVVLFPAVKFWRVEEPLTRRLPRVAREELLKLVLERVVEKKLVVVAAVPVARVKVKLVRVDEALERKPFWRARVVEVEFSPVPKVVNGKLKVAPEPVMVIGAAPSTVKLEHETVPEHVAEVVATPTRVFDPPKYAS